MISFAVVSVGVLIAVLGVVLAGAAVLGALFADVEFDWPDDD